MKKLKLEAMSSAELEDLRTRVEYQMRVRRDQEKAAIREQAKKLAEDAGFDLSEIIKTARKPKTKSTRTSKRGVIVNPQDPTKTWSGLGRRPQWVVEQGLHVK